MLFCHSADIRLEMMLAHPACHRMPAADIAATLAAGTADDTARHAARLPPADISAFRQLPGQPPGQMPASAAELHCYEDCEA